VAKGDELFSQFSHDLPKTDRDVTVGERMTRAWANFAAEGRPTLDGLQWEPSSEATRR